MIHINFIVGYAAALIEAARFGMTLYLGAGLASLSAYYFIHRSAS